MILAPSDPTGAAWNEAVLHGLGASTISHTDAGIIVAPDIDLSGYAAALTTFAAAAYAALKVSLCADIDQQAQALRDLYVTPGGAQAATYLFKQSQAQAAQAAQAGADSGKTAAQLASAYPYLANEIGITADPSTNQPATDIYGVARAVVATVGAWQPLNLTIEAMRLKTKVAINAATTAAAAQAAHDAVSWPPAP